MNSTLTALYASVDYSTILAVVLAVVGVAASAIRVLNRLSTQRKSPQALFPAVKSSGVQLEGPEKCSLDGPVFLRSQFVKHQDFAYDFPADTGFSQYQYEAQGHPQAPIQLSQAPPSAHAPKRRPVQTFEHHHAAPYYHHPRKPTQKASSVQIFSPTMSPNDPRCLEYAPEPVFDVFPGEDGDFFEAWSQPGFVNAPAGSLTIDVPQQHQQHPVTGTQGDLRRPDVPQQFLQQIPHQGQCQTRPPHAQSQPQPQPQQQEPFLANVQIPTPVSADTYSMPAVAAPCGPPTAPAAPNTTSAMGDMLDTDPLGYPLFDDVFDFIYDSSQVSDPAFAAMISQEFPSHSSSDHSDHELMFSPPHGQQHLSSSTDERSPGLESSGSTGSPDAQDRFVCPHCGVGFRIKGYLTRHLKKHARQKAYTCPFYDPDSTHKCHPTGGFSRRDTYKTHLKARHFIYPPNTPCGKRAQVAGSCSACQRTFSSNETWVESHIQTKECPVLVSVRE